MPVGKSYFRQNRKNIMKIDSSTPEDKWHHDIRITEDIRTSDMFKPYNGQGMVTKEWEVGSIQKLYGNSFSEKSVLDIACNAGGHLFECQMHGIKQGFGFDARDYWINQANWLKEHVNLCDTSNLTFMVSDMQILDQLENYDITFFNGIIYHLENPFLYLQKVANITNDLLVINTAYCVSCDYEGFVLSEETKQQQHALSGVGKSEYGLNWLPSSEIVLEKVLREYGFRTFSTLFKRPGMGRFCLLSRK